MRQPYAIQKDPAPKIKSKPTDQMHIKIISMQVNLENKTHVGS